MSKPSVYIQEPSFEPEEGEVYGEILDALNRSGIRYMLGGTLSLNAHTGIWRETKDLDVLATEEDVAGILEALEETGFETEITDPCWLAKAWKGGFFADIIHANHNGLGPVEESWFGYAKETKVLGRRVLVTPAEELLISKMFVAHRDRWDLSDVLHLIFAPLGGLDWERILAKVGEHWELLLAYLHLYRYVYPSHARYVPGWVFELLLERYEKETRISPQLPLRFRGTMLDEVSFQVDVQAWGLPDERAATREARCSSEERG
jgi:hypothetical protein